MHRQQAKVKEEKRLQVGDYVYSMTIKLAEGEYFVRAWLQLGMVGLLFCFAFFVFLNLFGCVSFHKYTHAPACATDSATSFEMFQVLDVFHHQLGSFRPRRVVTNGVFQQQTPPN